MIEYITILKSTNTEIWEEIESISTLLLSILTFFTLLYTIFSSRKLIQLDKEKNELQEKMNDRNQKQQMLQILKIFYKKRGVSISDATEFLRDQILSVFYLIDKKYISYVEEIKEKNIELDILMKKIDGLKASDQQYTEDCQNLIKESSELDVWLVKKGDEAQKEIEAL